MEVRDIPGAGRGFVATRNLTPGEIVLREEAYIFVPQVTSRGAMSTCIACFAEFPTAEPHPRCEACGEHYCSTTCLAAYGSTMHVEWSECLALQLCRTQRSEVSHDDYNHLRAMVAIAVRAKKEGLEEYLDEPPKRFRPKVAPEVEMVCPKLAPPRQKPDAAVVKEADLIGVPENKKVDMLPPIHLFTDNGAAVTVENEEEPSFTAVVEAGSLPTSCPLDPASFATSIAVLTANVSRFEEDQLEIFRGISAVYDALQEDNDAVLPVISEDMFLKISCAFQCNGFSHWNALKKEVASGIFGCAAMANHSCIPNIRKSFVGRELQYVVIRPASKGDELYLSYVDKNLSLNLRQWRLTTQYFFDCRCPRCKHELGIK